MLRNEKVVGKGLNALKKRLSFMYESKESCPVPMWGSSSCEGDKTCSGNIIEFFQESNQCVTK